MGHQDVRAPRRGVNKTWGHQDVGAPRRGGTKTWGHQDVGAPRRGGTTEARRLFAGFEVRFPSTRIDFSSVILCTGTTNKMD